MVLAMNYKADNEYYTPEYAITPLLEFIRKGSTVWCPFDTEQSNFVSLLKRHGCKVIATHIHSGYDFFYFRPRQHYDYIISNPPFSLKTEVLERLFKIGKPFAMLLGMSGIFDGPRYNLFKQHDFEMLLFDKRISFFKSYTDRKAINNPPFSTGYITSQVLPRTMIFRELHKPPRRKCA